ncbi:MAG: DegV family protein [Actinomycetota bacterium]|nr:DegV family protein [Actinomycetota bacterium]
MSNVQVITDSASSLDKGMLAELDIDVLSLYVNEGGMTHEETTMDIVAFYDRIGDLVDDIPTSSQASLEATAQAFVSAAEKGRDVFAGFIGSRMSGMFESACLVAKQVKERYPDWHACMLDTGSNSLDEGYGVLAAARAALRGAPLAECHDIAVRTCLSSRWLFTPRSLAFLKAGGRIGRAASLVGNLLRICPILTVFDGEVEVAGKYPTFNKSVSKIAKMFERDVRRFGLVEATVHYIGPREPAEEWARDVIEPIAQAPVDVLPVSPVIGVHVGPALGIVYHCDSTLPGKFTNPPEGVFF